MNFVFQLSGIILKQVTGRVLVVGWTAKRMAEEAVKTGKVKIQDAVDFVTGEERMKRAAR